MALKWPMDAARHATLRIRRVGLSVGRKVEEKGKAGPGTTEKQCTWTSTMSSQIYEVWVASLGSIGLFKFSSQTRRGN